MSPDSTQSPIVAALLCLGCGVFILLAAAGLIPAEPLPSANPEGPAPNWVVWVSGLVFVAGGGALLGTRWPRVRFVSLSVLLLGMAGVAFWAAVLTPSDRWDVSGGLPGVSAVVNVWIGRGLAGFGVLVCLGMLVYGWKTGFRSGRDST